MSEQQSQSQSSVGRVDDGNEKMKVPAADNDVVKLLTTQSTISPSKNNVAVNTSASSDPAVCLGKNMEAYTEPTCSVQPVCEEIKRRSSGSLKRNYRQTHKNDDSPSSDDESMVKMEVEGSCGDGSKVKSGESNVHKDDHEKEAESLSDNENTDDDGYRDRKSSRDSKNNLVTDPATPTSMEKGDSIGLTDAIAESVTSTSSNQSNTDTTDSALESDNETRVPRRLTFFSGGIELDDDDDGVEPAVRDTISSSSSSSESLHFLEDEDGLEDDSSESSDCILEDLEERPTVAVAHKKAGNDEKDGEESAPKKKKIDQKKKQDLPSVLQKPKPKSTWSGPREVFRREMGYRGKVQSQSAEVFRSKFYGSLFSVERLELMKKLDGHTGCVNCLNFNYSGTKLASGSDDLHIKIWNYGLGQLITSFPSGHRANVFQARFLPLIGLDTMIVSCARDCQVRLTELDSSGAVATSRKLAHHRGAAHKLTVNAENPQVILSCGEDGVVYSIDIREENPQRLLGLREKGKKVALYSIHGNPLVSHEFCVAGRDEYVRIYDIRKLSSVTEGVSRSDRDAPEAPATDNASPVKRFCPHHLQENRTKPHVTAAVYNYNGKEILGSYNDESIYLFDATHSDMADCIKVYEGHRNSATVKGVNFFGDRSQFIVSGSDCGHIFIWDKETESIVNFFRGDENGVVNCLEPHPSAPILATSGLDDDVKIWIPSSETAPKMGDLAPTVRKNIRKRKEELDRPSDALDGHIMMALWTHLQRANRNRRNTGDAEDTDSDDSWPHDEDEDDEDGDPDNRGMECSIS